MRLLLLAALVAASLPATAQVGILGGVQGDAQTTNRQFPSSDRARLIDGNYQEVFSIPLNGARNYNFYYADGVSAFPYATFLPAGPWRVEYITSGFGHAAGFDQGQPDDIYHGPNPGPSNRPYTPNPPDYTTNADVYFGNRNSTVFQLPVNLANPVPLNPNAPATGANVYRGALGIQGTVRASAGGATITGVTVTLLLRRDNIPDLTLSMVETNGRGFFSFYYSVGNSKGFIPPTNPANNGRYVVRVAKPGFMGREYPAFQYAPDAAKNPTNTGAVGNRNYFVVGAREFDAGAGLGDISLDKFTSGCSAVARGGDAGRAAPRDGAAREPLPCLSERASGSVEVDRDVAAAYIQATQAYVDAMPAVLAQIAARADAGLTAEAELTTEAKTALDAQDRLLGQMEALTVAQRTDAPAQSLGVSPNPLQGTGALRFTLSEPADVSANVFDALGRQVLSVVAGRLDAGPHTYRLDTAALAPGVYVVRLSDGASAQATRFTVVR